MCFAINFNMRDSSVHQLKRFSSCIECNSQAISNKVFNILLFKYIHTKMLFFTALGSFLIYAIWYIWAVYQNKYHFMELVIIYIIEIINDRTFSILWCSHSFALSIIRNKILVQNLDIIVLVICNKWIL